MEQVDVEPAVQERVQRGEHGAGVVEEIGQHDDRAAAAHERDGFLQGGGDRGGPAGAVILQRVQQVVQVRGGAARREEAAQRVVERQQRNRVAPARDEVGDGRREERGVGDLGGADRRRARRAGSRETRWTSRP